MKSSGYDSVIESMRSVEIILPHSKKEIKGFGYSRLSNIFWFFHDQEKLLYHYQDYNKHTLTEYNVLPVGVCKLTYEVDRYDENTSSLWLKLINEAALRKILLSQTSKQFGL